MPANSTPPYSPLRPFPIVNDAPAIPGDRIRAAAAVRRASNVVGSGGSRRTLNGLRADPRQAVQQDSIHCLLQKRALAPAKADPNQIRSVISAIDKAAKRGVIHPNAAIRRKARLTKALGTAK